MRFPYTRPRRAMLAVVSVLRTSFVAVPAFRRVEPASTSGPGASAMTTRPRRRSAVGVHATRMVAAPRARAACRPRFASGVAVEAGE